MEFRPFTPMHALCVAVCAAVIVAVCVIGRRARGTRRETALRRGIGWGVLAWWLAYQALWLSPRYLDWSTSLPLHVCDLAGLAAALAFLTDKRLFRTLLYFWGIALTTQGFLTPVITEGPGSPLFWSFWVSHTVIVGCAVYDFTASDYRPAKRDLLTAVVVTGGFVLAMVVLNNLTGWNYAYVGPALPDRPTIVDVLGPYPWRLIPMALIGIAAFTLVWLPWAIFSRRAPRA